MVDPTSRVGGPGQVGGNGGGSQPTPPSDKLVANLSPQEAARFDAVAVRAEKGEAVAKVQLAELTTLYEAREKGRLAQDVYDAAGGVGRAPEGWVRASEQQSGEILRANGLNANQLRSPDSDFRAEFYVPDPNSSAIPQDAKPVLVFRGSTVREGGLGPNAERGADWRTNADQNLLGRETDHYTRAMDAAVAVSEVRGGDFEIAGHSLGGGLGQAAVAVSGAKATLFNASGLHQNTAERYAEQRNVALSDVDALTTTYQVRGEVLTAMQEDVGPVVKPVLTGLAGGATVLAAGADVALDGVDLAGRGASKGIEVAGDGVDLAARGGGAVLDGVGRLADGAIDGVGDVVDGAADLTGDALGGIARGAGRGLGWLADKVGLDGDGVRSTLGGAGDRVDGGLDRAGDRFERGTDRVSDTVRGVASGAADGVRAGGRAAQRGSEDVSAVIDDGLRSLAGVRAKTDWAAKGGLIEAAMRAGPAAAGERVVIDAYTSRPDGGPVARDRIDLTDPGQAVGEMVDRHLMPTVLPSLDARIDQVEAGR